jgi:hypothetical protein
MEPLSIEQAKATTTKKILMHYPRPKGRVVVVDWWKGFSIFLMLFAHYFGRGITLFGASIDGGVFIPIGIVQLCNGLFFLLSSFGNYISVKKLIDRNKSLTTVSLIIILRGAILISLSMFGCSIFNAWLQRAIFQEYYYQSTSNPLQLSTTIVDQLFDPTVVPYIGFNTALSSLILVIITAYTRKQPKLHQTGANNQKKTANISPSSAIAAEPTSDLIEDANNMYTKLRYTGWISITILILNIPLRIVLDRATYTVGFDCQTVYNTTQVINMVPANFPDKCYTTHSPKLDFSDNKIFQPCANVTSATRNPLNKTWPTLKGFTTTLHDSYERCLAFTTIHKSKLATTAIAHTNDAERGYRWCPTNVSRDALLPNEDDLQNPKLEMCTLIPWWGPPRGVEGMGTIRSWSRLTDAQRAYNFFTWPWLGRYGYFAYGANSLLGLSIGIYVCNKKNGGWTPELFTALYKISFFGILLGMGPALALFVIDASGNETAQMASTWMRLLFGGIELMAFTISANVMEGRPNSGCVHCCGARSEAGSGNSKRQPCCRSCSCCMYGCLGASQFANHWFYRMSRRYGAISLTLYIIQDFIFDLTSITMNSIGGYMTPFCFFPMYSDNSQCGQTYLKGHPTSDVMTISLYVAINLLFFTIFIWLWEKIHFSLSFEWFIQKVLTIARGTKSTTITLHFQHHHGGDCTCRGLNSSDCCNIRNFCCGACENQRKLNNNNIRSKDGNVVVDEAAMGCGPGDIDIVAEENIKEVECTGSVATWGLRASIIATLIILGIIGGAQ